jgi:hypothetical protein
VYKISNTTENLIKTNNKNQDKYLNSGKYISFRAQITIRNARDKQAIPSTRDINNILEILKQVIVGQTLQGT